MNRTVSLVVCLAAVVTAAWPQTIGTITVIRGTVTIQRNGRDVPSRDLDLGMGIENLDLVRTARNSLIEIALDPRTGFNGRLTIRENTTAQVELSRLRSGPRGQIELLAGSVGLSVNRLAQGATVNVRTQAASMGVRGTAFDVTTAPEGSVLVTTSEGRVACEDPEGNTVFSEPGAAVEAGEEQGSLRVLPVAVSSLEQFRRDWIAQKIEAFRPNAPRAARQFAQLYQRQLREFDQAYARLDAQGPILQKWAREHQQGQIGARQEVIREKRAVIGPLLSLRRILFLFERYYYRLLEIREYLDNVSLNTAIGGGQTLRSFFAQMDGDAPRLRQRMGQIRFVAKLYALRNDGEVPGADFGEGGEDADDDFFE